LSGHCPGAARVPPTQINAFNSSWESMMTTETSVEKGM
jgi:hypothetical protein